MAEELVGSSILEVILEKTNNIEAGANRQSIKKLLAEDLKVEGKREHKLRHESISIRISTAKGGAEATIKEIDEDWVVGKGKLPPANWLDKEHVYVQFASIEEKNDFLDFAKISSSEKRNSTLTEIVRPNLEGLHFTRKPIRVIITNARSNIKLETVEKTLRKMLDMTDSVMEDLREGKPIQNGGAPPVRNIMFRLDAVGFRVLFKKHDGVIPYKNENSNIRIKLIARINARPFQCRECSQMGNHQCKGRTCGQCGQSGHLSKDCKSKTRFCNNCKRKGHRAKDTHCPSYLKEISKEIRRMDIPLEFLTEQEYRENLLRHIQLK